MPQYAHMLDEAVKFAKDSKSAEDDDQVLQ